MYVCACVCVCVREREREAVRKAEREREIEAKFGVVVGWITKRGFRKGKRNSTGRCRRAVTRKK